jgi:hypothetical protein
MGLKIENFTDDENILSLRTVNLVAGRSLEGQRCGQRLSEPTLTRIAFKRVV